MTSWPGGYAEGLRGLPENQRIILDKGFRWVSGEYSDNLRSGDLGAAVRNPSVDVPYAYDSGLIELPIQTWTDRSFFDTHQCVDRAALEAFKAEWGHKRLPDDWTGAPWTRPDALKRWLEYNLAVADYVYENRLLCVMCWHPYSHYVHDPDNQMLSVLLQWAELQPEPGQPDAVGAAAVGRVAARARVGMHGARRLRDAGRVRATMTGGA
jgi:hypothetical protein